jgi:peptide/nickel transport system substrate-binding protein
VLAPRREGGRLAFLAAAAICLVGTFASGAGTSGAATGWTITVASPQTSASLWAYPFLSGDDLTTQNVQDFEQLTYRPLYFFDGGAGGVSIDLARSLAEPPVYGPGDTSVSVSIKPGLAWSNGESVDPAGVIEWMNLDASFPSLWADYLPPLATGQSLGIPDDVESMAVHGLTVTFTLSTPVDPTWFTDNELSQITPLPAAWDRYEPSHPHVPMSGPDSVRAHLGYFTAATVPAGCYGDTWIGDGNDGPSDAVLDPLGARTVVPKAEASEAANCVDVVYLMRSASADAADYTKAGTNVAAAWGLSDGPWRLSSYNAATGSLAMLPNTAPGVAGPRPTASALQFVPCTSDASCTALLADGDVDQGELPVADAPHVTSLTSAPRHNPLAKAGYRESVVEPWAISFLPYNFASRDGAGGRAGSVFQQLYFRQALQSLDQESAMVASSLRGYGTVTDAPVPTGASSSLVPVLAEPDPFDVARARLLLSQHGWLVQPGGVTKCATPSLCGTGIEKGTPLVFTIVYAPVNTSLGMSLSELRVTASEAGIELRLHRVDETQVLDDVLGHGSNWDLASWDGGWSYVPDYYPSGEWLFASGSQWNVGQYNNPAVTTLVLETLASSSALGPYDATVARNLPVLWMPTPATIVETGSSVRGAVASSIGGFTPESWRRAVSGRSTRAAR